MGKTRKDRLMVRREEAKERQEAANQRTPQEQLARLDRMFGPGKGAKKERAKLAKKIKSLEMAKKAEKEEEKTSD